jgi:subtilase family protein
VALLAMSSANEPNKIQISNHSYGWVSGWDHSGFLPAWYGTWGQRESELFGGYDSTARDWDALCYAAPYYLPFKAAGNDRADSVPRPGERFEYYTEADGWQAKEYNLNTDPYPDAWDQGGYDTMPADATAKNTVAVGAIDISGGDGRDLAEVTMTGFSSWGPTDDGRIKPDLVAHGVDVYSTTAGSDRSYDVYSGTSMATAVASGAAALLPEFYARFSPERAMRSATIKALLIHTADDLGKPGPDYRYGWGLINAKAAVDHIQTHFDFPHAGSIVEDAVDLSTTTRSYAFDWDGGSPIRATVVWTDPPGLEVEGLDNPTLCLVNDLDLRVVGPEGTVYLPFVLRPSHPDEPATVGDNIRDNVEQVWIEAPLAAGQYLLEVTYKGTLVDQAQQYSLLLSGQQLGGVAQADLNGDGLIDWLDAHLLATFWLSDEPLADIAPDPGDGIVNLLDFAELAAGLGRNY